MKRFLDNIFPSTATATPSDGTPEPVAAGAEVAARSCPQCSAAAAPDQDWCLECGTRIDETGARWHQPVAVMSSIALIFVAGLALALSEVAKDPSIAGAKTIRKTVAAVPEPTPATSTPSAPKATNPKDIPKTSPNQTDTTAVPSTSSGSGASSDPFAGSTGATGSTSSGTTFGGGSTGSSGSSTTTTTPVTVPEWTFDKKLSYTVVFDDSQTSKSDAEDIARKLIKKGFTAGVLEASKTSFDYPEGIWLVWAGRFAKESQANDFVDKLVAKGLKPNSSDVTPQIKKASTKTSTTPTTPTTGENEQP